MDSKTELLRGAAENRTLIGEPISPPTIGRRKCTDSFCCCAFIVFLYGLWGIYVSARAHGNLAKLTHGFDWKGEICGVDGHAQDRPLLYWCSPDLSTELRLLDGVCVSSCPTGTDTRSWCPGKAKPFQEMRGSQSDLTREVVIGMARNISLTPDYPTVEALGYCFPSQNVGLMNIIMQDAHVSSLTKQVYLACHSALVSWRFLIGVGGISIGIGYAFLLVLWCCFAKLMYMLVFFAHATLLLSINALVHSGFDQEHSFFANYTDPPTARVLTWTCAAFMVTVWFLFSALCCYGRSALNVTIDSVRASCEVIARIPSMLLQPLLHSVVVLVILLSLLHGFAWLLSTGNIVPQDQPIRQGGVEIQGIKRDFEFTNRQWVQICYWLFGTVWIFETVSALGQFAISHAVIMETCFKGRECFPMCHGYAAGLIFHGGTLALGGFIIGCLKIVAALLALALRQMSNEQGVQGVVSRALCCCCAQCFFCIERLVTMVNDLVYTDVALRSVGYVQAAENVVSIAASNPATYAAIKGSATAVRVLGVTTIGGLGTFLSYQALSSSAIHRQLDAVFAGSSSMLATSNILGTTIAAGVICFYIAIAFMMVFYQTTYTLMYCMLVGVEVGEGGSLPRHDAEFDKLSV